MEPSAKTSRAGTRSQACLASLPRQALSRKLIERGASHRGARELGKCMRVLRTRPAAPPGTPQTTWWPHLREVCGEAVSARFADRAPACSSPTDTTSTARTSSHVAQWRTHTVTTVYNDTAVSAMHDPPMSRPAARKWHGAHKGCGSWRGASADAGTWWEECMTQVQVPCGATVPTEGPNL